MSIIITTVEEAKLGVGYVFPLPIKISELSQVTTVEIKGLPVEAQVSNATRSADGWTIVPADLSKVRITLKRPPVTSLQLAVEITFQDTLKGQAATKVETVTFTVPEDADFTPSTGKQKIWAMIVLISATLFVVAGWLILLYKAQGLLTRIATVQWIEGANLSLAAGPPDFRYDPVGKYLYFLGPMDAKTKDNLVKLATAIDQPETGTLTPEQYGRLTGKSEAQLADYRAAISRLAFKANGIDNKYLIVLLLLAGMSGVLGTQIRSFSNFVFIATTRNQLDLRRYWIWYVGRPASGFLLAIMAVLLLKAKLFVPSGERVSIDSGTIWWIAIAMLVGFSSDEFTAKLREISQVVFGKN